MGVDRRNPDLMHVNNADADQPAGPHSLISKFVTCFLKGIVSKLSTRQISLFLLVFVAEQAVWSLT